MPRSSHTVFVSQKDNKCRYPLTSLNPSSKKKQQDTITYFGKRIGGYFGPDVIAKFTKDESITSREWAEEEKNRAVDANKVANLFNKKLIHLNLIKMQIVSDRRRDPQKNWTGDERNQRIQFQEPQIAQVDSVATFDQSIMKQETCLIEDEISNSQRFICSSCTNKLSKKDKKHHFSEGDKENVLSFTLDDKLCLAAHDVPKQFILRSDSTRNLHTRNIQYKELHAFVHYFFCHYNGDIAIDHLEGEYEDDTGYTLSVPTYHSKDQRFGNNDNGVHGILRVIQNHVCTDLCRHLPEMRLETTVIPLPRSRLCG